MIRLLFWLVHYENHYYSAIAEKSVIDAVQCKCNLINLSLGRKMTIIGNGHVGIWARHARHVVRFVTWRDGPSGIRAYVHALSSPRVRITVCTPSGRFVW